VRLVVNSCWKYRDAWKPFFALLDKFWPNHTIPTLITDIYETDFLENAVHIFEGGALQTWCQLISQYACSTTEPILLFQEDFFLTAPVNESLIFHGLDQMKMYNAGCVRLYPCPGGDRHYGDNYFATVDREAPYRTSCQAAIWNPQYLCRIADASKGTAFSFEIVGTAYAQAHADTVLAFKREVQPWPLQYLCSGISAGLWNPDSKKLCDLHGIQNDWSMRPFAS